MAKRRSDAVRKGDLVEYEGEACRVAKRRRVSGLAMFQTSEHEVYLQTVEGEKIGWVAENEVEKVSGEAGGI